MTVGGERQAGGLRASRREFVRRVGSAALAATMGSEALARAYANPGKKKVRIGVVGGGFGCAFYWHEHPDCIVQAVSDLREDRRQRLVKTYGCNRVHNSLEELVLDKTVDAVAIFTGAPDHVRHCVLAMEHGKHVICAVPAACSLEECELLIDTVKRTGLTYMMAETSYYRQEAITARQWFREGKFGELFYCEAEYLHDMTHDGPRLCFYQGKPTWRYGFPPMLYPTHSLGLWVGVTGERLTEVMCLGWGEPDAPMMKDNVYGNPFWTAVACYKTEKGHMVRQVELRKGATGHCERASWIGSEFSFYMPHPNGTPAIIVKRGEKPQRFEQPQYWKTDMLPEPLRHPSGHGGSHTFLTHEFIDALVNERRPAVDVYEAVAYTAPGIVAHQSALRGGEQMKIPDFGRAT